MLGGDNRRLPVVSKDRRQTIVIVIFSPRLLSSLLVIVRFSPRQLSSLIVIVGVNMRNTVSGVT